MNFPKDCIQNLAESWWEPCNKETYPQPGSLLRAYLPHVEQVPHTLRPVDRVEPTEHKKALVIIEPLYIGQTARRPDLPIAALPLFQGELWAVYKAKVRPCLVVGVKPPLVDRSLRQGMAAISTSPTLIVAPYYGADQDGKRAGYNANILMRIRHAEYPQFMLDSLPIKNGPKESVLRFDHLQPIGLHHQSFEHTGYRLSDEARSYVLTEWLQWFLYGQLPEDGMLGIFRQEMSQFSDAS